MATGTRPSRRDSNDHQRARKKNAILLTILAALAGAGFIAAMILWAYKSDRFK